MHGFINNVVDGKFSDEHLFCKINDVRNIYIVWGKMIYYCTFSDSSNRECFGTLITAEESYGSASGTVRFTGDIANEEAFGFIVAPNKSVLNDYIDALESGLTQLDTWSSTVQETE